MAVLPLTYNGSKAYVKPTNVGIFLTNRCNSRCSICDYWKPQPGAVELSTAEWLGVLDDIRSINAPAVNFTADGELFTRPDAFEIMNHAKKLGFQILINTNGLLLDRYIDEICTLSPLQVTVSLDAFNDESYEKIRGVPNGFTRVMKSVLLLKNAGFSRISVGSVLTASNLGDCVKIQQFCLENNLVFRVTAFQFEGFGADNNHLRPLYKSPEFIGRLRETVSALKTKPINNCPTYLDLIEGYFTKDKFHPLKCVVGLTSLFIYANGDVGLCNLMRERAKIGTVRSGSLTQLWYGEQANHVRRQIREKACMSCWLSCFAEENIRHNYFYLLKNSAYFFKKCLRIFL
jgi:Fe-coproporphyrin III synthase